MCLLLELVLEEGAAAFPTLQALRGQLLEELLESLT